jgi:hypothetical protein
MGKLYSHLSLSERICIQSHLELGEGVRQIAQNLGRGAARPDVSRTIEAAALATPVAPETEMPQSAFFNPGASFTPSPVMPTMWPQVCNTSTI